MSCAPLITRVLSLLHHTIHYYVSSLSIDDNYSTFITRLAVQIVAKLAPRLLFFSIRLSLRIPQTLFASLCLSVIEGNNTYFLQTSN